MYFLNKKIMTLSILLIFSNRSCAQEIITSPQMIGNSLLQVATYTSPAILREDTLQQRQGIDYDHCLSSDTIYIHTFTLPLIGHSCLIMGQDKRTKKITGIIISGPHTASSGFRNLIYRLIDVVEDNHHRTAIQNLRLQVFLTIHEWYNSSISMSLNGFNYRYYTNDKHRIFILTSSSE